MVRKRRKTYKKVRKTYVKKPYSVKSKYSKKLKREKYSRSKKFIPYSKLSAAEKRRRRKQWAS